jgi:hypothetical protein
MAASNNPRTNGTYLRLLFLCCPVHMQVLRRADPPSWEFHQFLKQRYTNSGGQIARATKFCTVERNTCGSSVWNLLHITSPPPGTASVFLENLWTHGLATEFRNQENGRTLAATACSARHMQSILTRLPL